MLALIYMLREEALHLFNQMVFSFSAEPMPLMYCLNETPIHNGVNSYLLSNPLI